MDEKVKRIKREIFGKPKEVEQEQPNIPSNINSELLKMFPPERVERIKKKELRRYEQAQGKKWKKWLESVSE